MIPFNFIYFRPGTLREAVEIFHQLSKEGKKAYYYAGGSEIISMCRVGEIKPDAVIDIKSIPECMQLECDREAIFIGSACTLSHIKDSGCFPLLGKALGRIADHTNQCRITLGGNLCGSIRYREASLPLLLTDADITLFSVSGERTVPFRSVFDGRMRKEAGEIVVSVTVPALAASAPYFHIKKTGNEKIDYPLVSISALVKDDTLHVAVSGVCSNPFRSKALELLVNDHSLPRRSRVERAYGTLPEQPYSDAEASGEYRAFVFQNTVEEILEAFENGKV